MKDIDNNSREQCDYQASTLCGVGSGWDQLQSVTHSHLVCNHTSDHHMGVPKKCVDILFFKVHVLHTFRVMFIFRFFYMQFCT